MWPDSCVHSPSWIIFLFTKHPLDTASLGAVHAIHSRRTHVDGPTHDYADEMIGARVLCFRPGRSCWLLPRGRPASSSELPTPRARPKETVAPHDHVKL